MQRVVVITYRSQTLENHTYGLADKRLHELLFPGGHPYSWPTIGYTRDLEAMTLEDARTFYSTYYTAGNAVLAFAGDISAEDAFALAERYFGDLPSGPELPEALQSTGLTAVGVRETMEDAVSFPRTYRAWAVPGYGTRDWVALDVLAYLLADGESSRLQRALVREGQLAQDVDTYLYPTALCGIFGIVSTARSGVDVDVVDAAIRHALDSVARGDVGEDEVLGAVRRVRRDHVGQLATVEERADALAYAATVCGDAEALNRISALYDEITADDVERVAAQYLDEPRGVTLIVVPDGAEEVQDAA